MKSCTAFPAEREGKESHPKPVSKVNILMWAMDLQSIVTFLQECFCLPHKPIAGEMQGIRKSSMPASLTTQYKRCLFPSSTIANRSQSIQASSLGPIPYCSLLPPPLCALKEWELLTLMLYLLLLGLLIHKPSTVQFKPFLQQSFLGAKWGNPLLKDLLWDSLKPRDRAHYLPRPVFSFGSLWAHSTDS